MKIIFCADEKKLENVTVDSVTNCLISLKWLIVRWFLILENEYSRFIQDLPVSAVTIERHSEFIDPIIWVTRDNTIIHSPLKE